jgi:hypothetical protein
MSEGRSTSHWAFRTPAFFIAATLFAAAGCASRPLPPLGQRPVPVRKPAPSALAPASPTASTPEALTAEIQQDIRAAIGPRPVVELDTSPPWRPPSAKEESPLPYITQHSGRLVVAGFRRMFGRCLETDSEDPSPRGMAVTIVVGPNGEVVRTEVFDLYGTPTANMRLCVARLARYLNFDPPGGSGAALVVTMHFRSPQ